MELSQYKHEPPILVAEPGELPQEKPYVPTAFRLPERLTR